MKEFPDELRLRVLNPEEVKALGRDVAVYELMASFRYASAVLGVLTVPISLKTDFASIPRAALWYMKDDDPGILMPSVVHDYLYSLQGVLPTSQTYSREQADEVLRDGMKACGARGDQIAVVFRAVRLFGGGRWQ